jgi:hypothetical protein
MRGYVRGVLSRIGLIRNNRVPQFMDLRQDNASRLRADNQHEAAATR